MFMACMAREADAVGEAMRETVDVAGLAAGYSAVVGIEEADEADVGAAGLGGEVEGGALAHPGSHVVRRIALRGSARKTTKRILAGTLTERPLTT